ncbi:MAG: hypothetical protein RL757_3349 [Bacteroidota bacterium]|jgi:photosystem II stability/assembly factor-like uncharacterized protein
MKKLVAVLMLFWACLIAPPSISPLFGQKIDVSQFKNVKIRSIGPAAMSGRITAIDVDLKSNTIYAGAASGGVWKSEGGGVSWTPIFDKQPTQNIGAIAVNQTNPSEIWVGTGEGNPRNSHNSGMGIFKSNDGGKTWKHLGLEKTKTIHRICINPLNPNIVYVAAMGSIWGKNEERGVFKTSDGGKTWQHVLKIGDETGAADMVMDPSNPNKLVVAMWEYGRKPWKFISGGKTSGLYITTDGFETVEKKTEKDGLPAGDLGRMGLAICKSKPNVMYALIEAKENAIYRSNDGGVKWNKVGDNGDRPFYYAEIYVDPNNENRLYNLYSRVSRSEDGGKNWQVILPYEWVHPDHHAWWIDPRDPNHMMDGNDGGLNITYDGGKTWMFAQNIPVGQFYHVNVDDEKPYNIYGGLQDNGSWVGPSAVWKSGGIRNADWQEVMFGDGFDAMVQKGNPRFGYAMSQGGNLGRFDRKTGATEMIQPQVADQKLRYNWNAALAQDPFDERGIYYGSQMVHYSSDFGKSWLTISPDLTTSDTFKMNESQRTGGLTPDVTNAENHCTILAIAPSPVDRNIIWVGTDDGNLQLTQDGGKTWTNFAGKLPNCPKNAWIPQIEVSAKNVGEAFVVVNHYRFNDWRAFVYHTSNFGKTWTLLVDDSKVNGHCHSVLQDIVEPNLIFVGTELGLYVSIDYGKTFTKWTENFPSVPVIDMKIHPREHDLVIGTFGRSIWIFDDIRPLRALAKSGGKVLETAFKMFDSPDAYSLLGFRSTDGERFQASAIFEGDNRFPSALLTVFVGKSAPNTGGGAKTDDKKPPIDRAKFHVINEKNDTIRTFSAKLDTGMNRLNWDLREKGGAFISWNDRPADADESALLPAAPGRYKIVGVYKSAKDSTFVNVQPDPRYDASIWADIADKNAQLKEFSKIQKTASESFNRLKESVKTIELADAQLVNAPDSVKTALSKLGKSMKDSILTLQKMYTLPRDAKGINRSPNALDDAMGKAFFSMATCTGKISPNALITGNEAKARAKEIIEAVNKFYENQWKTYQEKIDAAKYSIFKTYTPFKID